MLLIVAVAALDKLAQELVDFVIVVVVVVVVVVVAAAVVVVAIKFLNYYRILL